MHSVHTPKEFILHLQVSCTCHLIKNLFIYLCFFYLQSAYSLIFLITVLGFVTFSILCDGPQNRMAIVAILLLTSANFRWLITARLPAVSYLTLFDKFSIGGIFILTLMFSWHGIIGSTVISSNINTIKSIDTYLLYVFAACFVIFMIAISVNFGYMGVKLNSFKKKSSIEYNQSETNKKEYALALRKKTSRISQVSNLI